MTLPLRDYVRELAHLPTVARPPREVYDARAALEVDVLAAKAAGLLPRTARAVVYIDGAVDDNVCRAWRWGVALYAYDARRGRILFRSVRVLGPCVIAPPRRAELERVAA